MSKPHATDPHQPTGLVDDVRDQWQVALLLQRDETLLAQPLNPDSAMLSGTPVPIANGVGAYVTATSGLWSVARKGALVYRLGGAELPRPTWLDFEGNIVGAFGDPASTSIRPYHQTGGALPTRWLMHRAIRTSGSATSQEEAGRG